MKNNHIKGIRNLFFSAEKLIALAVEKIVAISGYFTRKSRMPNAVFNDSVGQRVGVAEGADFHTQAAVGADYAPVFKAGLHFELPFLHPADIFFAALGNRSGGAVDGAFKAFFAEILHSEFYGLVGR